MKIKRRSTAPDPRESAQAIGLRYLSDNTLGIRRHRMGKNGFRYIYPDGRIVKDPATLHRIASIVIPPAWENVWISPIANSHLQATGRDVRGRKQHKYHP